MVIIIDNYDSFTFNLVQAFQYLGQTVRVFKNDRISVDKIASLAPDRIVISPGPGTPKDAGISKAVIEYFYQNIPVLGVCLGNQCIAEIFGGEICRAPEIMHGKSSGIFHAESGLFKNLPNPFSAGRYHSWMIKRNSLPEVLEISAFTKNQIIMAVQHRQYPLCGVQFHPESIMTENGIKIFENFLRF